MSELALLRVSIATNVATDSGRESRSTWRVDGESISISFNSDYTQPIS